MIFNKKKNIDLFFLEKEDKLINTQVIQRNSLLKSSRMRKGNAQNHKKDLLTY